MEKGPFGHGAMSAYGYTRTFPGVGQRVRFAPKTGHSCVDVGFGPDYVCLALNSGRKWAREFESGYDPKRTFDYLLSRMDSAIHGR